MGVTQTIKKLDNIHFFAKEVMKRVDNVKIDVLILNAGTNTSDINIHTSDGFETVFAINHIANYLLIRLLLPYMAEGSIIVITMSGTHDPAERSIIPPPKHADALLLAHPENDNALDIDPKINAGRAYSSSKLCNILTARFLITDTIVKANKIKIVAYDPGLTPGTDLVRYHNFVIHFVWKVLSLNLFRVFIPHMNSCKASGETLADIAQGIIQLPEDRFYAALRKGKITWPSPSELALNDQVMEKLWKDSAKLVGLSE